MVKVASPDGGTYIDYPLLEDSIFSSFAQRIVVDNGAIILDHANHTDDLAHLVLDGVLSAGQDYLKITKNGEKLLNADYTGKLHCHKDVTGPNITALENTTAALQTIVNNSTHENTHDTLVKRNNNGSTTFEDLTTNIISVSQDCALYGDAALTYTPQTEQEVNIPGYLYRFGRNTEELGDYSGVGNGLEMKQPDIQGVSGNKILIQVNETTPTIELQVNKETTAVEWVLIRDETDAEALILDQEGCRIQSTIKSPVLLTPGVDLNLNSLSAGPQTHRFTLTQAWPNTNVFQHIEISGDVSASEHRGIENLEVVLDDLSLPATITDIDSRIYIQKWGVYRNTKQRLWMILAVEFRNNENGVANGSLVRLSFNNKLYIG